MHNDFVPILDATLKAAMDRFDEVGRGDPRSLDVDGQLVPYQLAEAQCLERYVRRLTPTPSTALVLACRCQHLARWQLPRQEFPNDREGYLKWRRAASAQSAALAQQIMSKVGVEPAVVAAVVEIVTKRRRPDDPNGQLMEDALCLAFLRLEAATFAARHPIEKVRHILERTWRKMSVLAREVALREPFDPAVAALLTELPVQPSPAVDSPIHSIG